MEERPSLRDLARVHRFLIEQHAPPGAPLVVPEPTLELARRRTRLDPDTLSPSGTLKEKVSRARVAGHGQTEVVVRKETTARSV